LLDVSLLKNFLLVEKEYSLFKIRLHRKASKRKASNKKTKKHPTEKHLTEKQKIASTKSTF